VVNFEVCIRDLFSFVFFWFCSTNSFMKFLVWFFSFCFYYNDLLWIIWWNVPLQVIGKLVIPIGVSCFENVYACCHLPFVTIQINSNYCYNYKNILGVECQPHIFCKIKQQNGNDCDSILIGSWIKSLFGHDLINFENFKQKQGFFLRFRKKCTKGRFILSLIAEIVRFFIFNKDD
jgi:hypothetical protein